MKRDGYRETTIAGKGSRLRRLIRFGANLLNPESVKEVIATQNWCDSGKETTAYAYDLFTRRMEINWQRPKYKAPKTLPFIPHERKIDDLIAEGNKYVATFLKSLRKQLPEPAKYST